jgi:hypothetical protein
MSIQSGSHTPGFENALHAATDALLSRPGDRERVLDWIVGRYAVSRRDAEPFVRLIERLHVTLIGVQPSPRFVARLKHELVGERAPDLLARIRYLPPRIQIAAGVALVAGFMILARRRLTLDALAHAAEAATQDPAVKRSEAGI